eukprot:352731-Chlamydomonas_euryale.AAC.8
MYMNGSLTPGMGCMRCRSSEQPCLDNVCMPRAVGGAGTRRVVSAMPRRRAMSGAWGGAQRMGRRAVHGAARGAWGGAQRMGWRAASAWADEKGVHKRRLRRDKGRGRSWTGQAACTLGRFGGNETSVGGREPRRTEGRRQGVTERGTEGRMEGEANRGRDRGTDGGWDRGRKRRREDRWREGQTEGRIEEKMEGGMAALLLG